ncbi:enoyl-CoA hydratase/carnithine racemase [Pseudomonas sp. GM33]|uniref:enoyl-CoA hydratase/isomerase family protein n=1 Tax=Pseudomonas sp. GM33 TaxID=1144329 RepID=UPI00026FF1E9|nr:enoyl-CoA hydratase/isomerase family protein [Pseudomonas sp. GM33]EJM34487.1 enoyl-CoA hydratase/carnithine racemase [Pseudomonas sp. GM33]
MTNTNVLDNRYSKYEHLLLDMPHPRVLRIMFNNPGKLNSIPEHAHTELVEIWRDIDADPKVSAVIITGKDGVFSAGGDFSLVQANIDSHATRLKSWKEAKDLVYNFINFSKPVISAMRGPAAGAGLVCGLLADVSIASKTAVLTDGHTRLGVAAGDHAVMLWPLLCGIAKAKYYLMTCEHLSGEEAERIGLVSFAVEDAEVEARALKVAVQLAEGAQTAIRWTKYALNNWLRQAGPAFDASLALEVLGFAGPEVQEGLNAHLEKRRPSFPEDCPI